jgi:hypothetical protein
MAAESVNSKVDYKPGLTIVSAFAMIIAAVLFIPVTTYATFTLGIGLGAPAVFSVTLLISELASLSRYKLSRQEMLIVYYGTGVGGTSASAILAFNILFNSYFIKSPFAWGAMIDGKPLALLVPGWIAPPFGSAAYAFRSLFQPAFAEALLVATVITLLSTVSSRTLMMIISRIYLEIERLPFPYADVDVSLVTFLTDRSRETASLLIAALGIGLSWGVFVYAIPILTGFMLIPIPMLDPSPYIQDFLPGAAFGISTTLISYFSGFIVPFPAAAYMFGTSFILYVVMQSLFITTFPNWFPGWTSEYMKGMGLMAITSRASARIWFAPAVGAWIGMSLFMVFRSRKAIWRLLAGSFRKERYEKLLNFPRLSILALLYIGSVAAQVAIFAFLMPDVPAWLFVFYMLPLSFIVGLVTTAMVGETGFSPSFSSPWPVLLYTTSYNGYAAFAYTPPFDGSSVPGFAQQAKGAIMTGTSPRDIGYIWIIGMILALVVGTLSLSFLWSLAPIPSSAYPTTVYWFPSSAMSLALLSTRQMSFTIEMVYVPMVLVLVVSAIGEALSRIGLVWSMTGFYLGLQTPAYSAFPVFIGSLVGRLLMPRIVGGNERWREVRGYIVAGEGLGEGLVILAAVSFSFIGKSGWIWPW